MKSTEENLAALRAGQAHVWLTLAPAVSDEEKLVWEMLSDAERKRAEKFHQAANCAEFVRAHALVRAALSRYHPVAPGAWQFGHSPQGKPFISGPAAAPPLQFNLSHTRGLAACVVTLDAAAGVDVEAIEPQADLLAVARQFFAPAAVQALENLSGAEQTIRFYEHWTRLEACAKASGTGLATTSPAAEMAGEWRCWQQRVSPDHMLAAAVRGGRGRTTVFTLRTMRWTDLNVTTRK